MRQPMGDHIITISRAQGSLTFLVDSASCGYERSITRFKEGLTGPVLLSFAGSFISA